MSQETHASGALARHLPTFLIVLMAIQPLMDILSFWTDRLGMSQHAHAAAALRRVRRCVRARVRRPRRARKAYGIAAGACIFVLVGHVHRLLDQRISAHPVL